jgi:hypothetical protein
LPRRGARTTNLADILQDLQYVSKISNVEDRQGQAHLAIVAKASLERLVAG